jgi:hypothetical protein
MRLPRGENRPFFSSLAVHIARLSSALMLADGPMQSTAVITLFAIGELGATRLLCSRW